MPFVATSVDQLRVGDEVEANNESGSLERGVIRRIELCSNGRDVMIHFGDLEWHDRVGWYFDPNPHFDFTRTWTVLSRDLEPASSLRSVAEADAPRPGDRIALVRRREGVVREVGDDYVRFEDGGLYSSKEALSYPWDNWTQTIEIIERAPEPLTVEGQLADSLAKLAAIKALLEEPGFGTAAQSLAAKIADVLK